MAPGSGPRRRRGREGIRETAGLWHLTVTDTPPATSSMYMRLLDQDCFVTATDAAVWGP